MVAISFVVAAYRKPERLALCLHALRNQIYGDFEIIVADDGSPPGENDKVAAAYGALYLTHERTRVNGVATRNMPWVLNTGVGAAQGVIVQTLQEDHIVAPDFSLWLSRTVRHDTVMFGLTNHDDRAWTHADVDSLLRTLHLPDGEVRYDLYADHGRSTIFGFDNWRHCDGLDAAFFRSQWDEGLDTNFVGQGHEWLDWFLRWKLKGGYFAVNPLLRLYHMDEPPAPNKEQWEAELAASYVKMIVKYGVDIWSVELIQDYPYTAARPAMWARQDERGLR